MFTPRRPAVERDNVNRGSRVRMALGTLGLLMLFGALVSCTTYPVPETTAVNPETFPQPLPPRPRRRTGSGISTISTPSADARGLRETAAR